MNGKRKEEAVKYQPCITALAPEKLAEILYTDRNHYT